MTPDSPSTTPTIDQIEAVLGKAYADLARIKAANKTRPNNPVDTGAIERRIAVLATQLAKMEKEAKK
jgi:uncharacterized protein involved in exopolysaccharide biosynthesis